MVTVFSTVDRLALSATSDTVKRKRPQRLFQLPMRIGLTFSGILLAGMLTGCGTTSAFDYAAADCPVTAAQAPREPGDTVVLATHDCTPAGHVSAFGSWLPAGATHF